MCAREGEVLKLFYHIGDERRIVTPDVPRFQDLGYCTRTRDAGVLLRPAITEELSETCKPATAHGIGLVPQGGLTGLVEGTGVLPTEAAI